VAETGHCVDDSLYRQILEFQEKAGRFEHLILASRSGFMTRAEAKKGLTLFAKEVLPRLRKVVPGRGHQDRDAGPG
jgi:hypothetical protein